MQNRITIEGNIGCGKSTVLESFRGYNDYEIVLEPVEVYTNFHGYNLLSEQQDPTKRLACQIAIADSLYERIDSCCAQNAIVERGAGSVDIFLEFYKDKYTDFEFKVLKNNARVHELIKVKALRELIIYLRCSPETALQRIKRRGRRGEENIDAGFIRKLSEIHDSMLIGKPGVAVIDANQSLDKVRAQVVRLICPGNI